VIHRTERQTHVEDSDERTARHLRLRLSELTRISRFIPDEPLMPWGFFRLFKSTTNELTHSYVLAYLLHPRRPHGLGVEFLQAFLRRLRVDLAPGYEAAEVDTEVSSGNIRADIVIDTKDAAVIVENKLHSSEGPEQTLDQESAFRADDRYKGKQLAFVFLTPNGMPAKNPNFIPASYRDVSAAIADLQFAHMKQLPIDTFVLLSSLVRQIEESICMENKDWAVIPERSKLYLEFAKDIQQVGRAFKETVGNIQRGWCDLAQQVMPGGGWESGSGKWVQVYKPEWKQKGYFIHFELDSSVDRLSKREVVFMLDVEKSNGAPNPDICQQFDNDTETHGTLTSIESRYRPSFRKHAIAYKTYHFADDLSDVAEVLSRSFAEHRFLVAKVDKVLAEL